MVHFDFSNRVALVTGASQGMGAELIRLLAQAQAQCWINYFPNQDCQKKAEALAYELNAIGCSVKTVGADVSQEDQVRAMMETIKSASLRLDILVNNAGILRDRTIKKMSSEEWHAVMQTNLDGVFYCSKYGAEILSDGGRIVNMASIAGIVGFPGQVNYSAAKAGVIAITRVLAKELAKRQITVNAVAPGMIETPMIAGVRQEVLAEYVKQIPLGRFGKAGEVAQTVAFLASDAASYITGQVLPVTGGWH
ncbi:MAG: 3-oxoacyl-ACP reductase FabG [Gemmataceae bacterium]|nr:3-oxoacyl-ACP reductase FabG [Gemmataceae bacterium]